MLRTPENSSSSDSDERSLDEIAGRLSKRLRLELGRTSESDLTPEEETVTIRPENTSAQQDDLAKNGYISLSEQVHDIDRFTPHVANAATLARILGEAADAAVKARQDRNKPPQVAVLLLQWEEDDLGVNSEIQNLRDVFARSYGFQTKTWAIPSAKAVTTTVATIDAFISAKDQNDEPVDKEGNLFILYYGGHAHQRDHEQPTWVPYRKSLRGMRMDTIFSMFDGCDADVLFLFDSCQAMPQPLDSFGKGFVSAITATGSDPNPIGIAAEVGPDSFTSSLIKVLGLMARGPHGPQSFTESDLYNKLYGEISKAPARLEEKSDGTLVFDSNGHVIPVRRKRRCPFLRPLSRNKMARPISIPILHRFGRNKESGPLFNVDRDSFGLPASLEQADIKPEVLVSFRLMPDEMKFDDRDRWARLMLQISDAISGQGVTVGEIKIEGLFLSDSSLLLLRIPMNIWNLLRRHRSATFIGNVYGENRAKQFEDAVRAQMLELRHTEAEKTELSDGGFPSSTSSDGQAEGTATGLNQSSGTRAASVRISPPGNGSSGTAADNPFPMLDDGPNLICSDKMLWALVRWMAREFVEEFIEKKDRNRIACVVARRQCEDATNEPGAKPPDSTCRQGFESVSKMKSHVHDYHWPTGRRRGSILKRDEGVKELKELWKTFDIRASDNDSSDQRPVFDHFYHYLFGDDKDISMDENYHLNFDFEVFLRMRQLEPTMRKIATIVDVHRYSVPAWPAGATESLYGDEDITHIKNLVMPSQAEQSINWHAELMSAAAQPTFVDSGASFSDHLEWKFPYGIDQDSAGFVNHSDGIGKLSYPDNCEPDIDENTVQGNDAY